MDKPAADALAAATTQVVVAMVTQGLIRDLDQAVKAIGQVKAALLETPSQGRLD